MMAMGERRVFLTSEQALAMLVDGDVVGIALNADDVLWESNWERQWAVDLINSGALCELSGPKSTALGYGLAVDRGDTYIFMRTKEAK